MNLPKTCEVNRFIAKKKFYEHTNMSETIKNSFVNDIEKITWDYKLAPDTLNLSKTDNVIEIEIFTINLIISYFIGIVKICAVELSRYVQSEIPQNLRYDDNALDLRSGA